MEGEGIITVHCLCGKKLKAPASAIGKKARCPACGDVMRLSPADPHVSVPREISETTRTIVSQSRPSNADSDKTRAQQAASAAPLQSRVTPPSKSRFGGVVPWITGGVILLGIIIFWLAVSKNRMTRGSAHALPQTAAEVAAHAEINLRPQPPAEWASQPTDKWPQLCLTNLATFEGHSPLVGGSAFLIRMPDGNVVMGSAKHLLTEIGGVVPDMTLNDLNTSLKRWRIGCHNKRAAVISVKGTVESINAEDWHDWLLMNLVSPNAPLPCTPLVPRLRNARVGETVYMLGVPHSDRTSSQDFYKGVVISRPHDHYFQYQFSPPVHIAGFAGAPIVDSNGLLLGQALSEGTMRQQDGKEIEFGGQDASLAVWLYEHRSDPVSVPPEQALQIDPPARWTIVKGPKDALITACIANWGIEVHVFAVPKTDLLGDVSLSDWLAGLKPNIKVLNAANYIEGDIVAGRVGDRQTFEYRSTGSINGIGVHFRVIAFEVNGCYCRLLGSVPDPLSDWAQGEFDRFVLQVTSK